jgi:hypothetical protein
MINFNPLLTKEKAQWILEQWYIFDYRIAHPTLSKIMEMHNLAFKEQVGVPSCGCEFRAVHAVWTSRLNQYKQQIEDIAYPPVVLEEVVTTKTRGRKKNTHES